MANRTIKIIKLINMFAVWEYEGGHKTIYYIFKRSKRSALSGIMGKAIPQLGPSVAETASFKEFSTGLRER